MTEVEIIENTKKSQDEYGHSYGSSTVVLTDEQMKALKNGKQLAFNDGEYSTFLTMKEPE